jgi:uncharacterized protein
MPRPKKPRFCSCLPCSCYFKPQGIPLRMLREVVLSRDEFEAINLAYVDDLDQVKAAVKMRISQPTFARILKKANKKIAQAIIKGQAIKINK